jgi:RNA polymerase Rpb1, domain 5.
LSFGETKRGIIKISITGLDEGIKTYSIPYGKHVVVHEGDNITAGTSLCEGSISPIDILRILGPNKVREYLVNEIHEVYRLHGVKIDDKHIEVIVRQMMQKVSIDEAGDSNFLPKDRINRA